MCPSAAKHNILQVIRDEATPLWRPGEAAWRAGPGHGPVELHRLEHLQRRPLVLLRPLGGPVGQSIRTGLYTAGGEGPEWKRPASSVPAGRLEITKPPAVWPEMGRGKHLPEYDKAVLAARGDHVLVLRIGQVHDAALVRVRHRRHQPTAR
jgi:hypothetical protein